MRKLYIFLFFAVGLAGGAKGQQPFAPVGAKWHYTEVSMTGPEISYTWFESVKDTIVANQSCRKIIGSSGCAWKADYLFDRNDSVFFYNNAIQQFDLLYNFAASVGDSWTIHHPVNWGGDNDSTTLTVDSTSSITIDGVNLKVLYTRAINEGNNNWWSFKGEHIQRIGAAYLFPVFGACDPVPGGLNCYQDSTIFYKKSQYDCDYISSINAIDNKRLSIYPNPVQELLYIDYDGTILYENIVVEITDLLGKIIYKQSLLSQENSLRIETADWSKGLYLYYISSPSGSLQSGKLIIEK